MLPFRAARPRRLTCQLTLAAGGLWLSWSALGGLVAADAAQQMQRAATALQHSATSSSSSAGAAGGAEDAPTDRLTDALRAAHADFAAAGRQLRSPLLLSLTWTPGGRGHVLAARTAADAGTDVAAAALTLATAASAADLGSAGAINVDALHELGVPLRAVHSELTAADTALQQAQRRWLLPGVRSRLHTGHEQLRRAAALAATAEQGRAAAVSALGADGPRRYLLTLTTPAEARAGAGMPGAYGTVTVDRGQLTLEQFGKISELNLAGGTHTVTASAEWRARYATFKPEYTWQNLTMTPDFPTAAAMMAELLPQAGGPSVDGVIALDPIALAGLLQLTGPVTVPGWDVPLTATNAPSVLLNEHYSRFSGDQRTDFLAAATTAIFTATMSTDLPEATALRAALGPAVRSRHLSAYATDAAEQHALVELGLAGQLEHPVSDSLGVYTQNAGGNKLDFYLDRTVDYRVRPGRDGQVSATLTLTLTNRAPTSGPPAYVLGGGPGQVGAPGVNRTLLSVYSPLQLRSAHIDGRAELFGEQVERGHRVYSRYVDLPAGSTTTLRFELDGALPQPYTLTVQPQPLTRPDTLHVQIGDAPVLTTALDRRLHLPAGSSTAR